MLAGIRTRDLRKVYTSPPPLASGGGFGFGTARNKKHKQSKAEIVALDGLTFEILPGEIFGLLGPNGAGKSTTAGILTTRVRPTSGRAWIGEHDVWAEQVVVKRLIGVVQQRPNLDFSLTAREILLFHGAYFGLRGVIENITNSENPVEVINDVDSPQYGTFSEFLGRALTARIRLIGSK